MTLKKRNIPWNHFKHITMATRDFQQKKKLFCCFVSVKKKKKVSQMQSIFIIKLDFFCCYYALLHIVPATNATNALPKVYRTDRH